MTQLDGIIKPKTKRSKRFLENRAPKLVEDVKSAMIMKGGNTNQTITQALKDIEFFSKKTDCSLFVFGSHNKKRPNNLVFGRLFDFHVLDMIEVGVEKYVSLSDIKNSKVPEGTKPMLVFAGEAFDSDVEHKRLKSLLIDFFRGPTVSAVRLAGLEHPKKKKNISHDTFGTKFGRVHMQKQDLSKLQTRKMKGLRKRRGPVDTEDKDTQAPKVVKVDS
ncbi:hypothetical protein FQN60_015775 [Etheostoma spectabile]|uniref:Ribosome production factor 2 homolog n=1 Tax=Etheostoma spectabile TaxID=54343 RepID=A0A5J5CQS8_9PERO|nr:hypothetical protein FQN60_015775 [Etheostoma spectabile]